MMVITQTEPPSQSLIAPFTELEAHYVDAFHVTVPGEVSLATFVEAFYTTPLFRAERFVLRMAARKPSRDEDVAALAAGDAADFAAWTVEARTAQEVLLADYSGRTKSWLHVASEGEETALWFGSVVVPVKVRGQLTLGPVFQTLLGAHKLYSRLLLKSAARRVGSSRPDVRASRP